MRDQSLHVRNVAMVLAAIIMMLITAPALTSDNDKGPATHQNPTGKAAPSFELSGLDGKTYRLSDFVDSIPLIVWFTNLCEGCQASIPHLDSIYREDIKPQAELLAISLLGKNYETVEEISEKLEFDFPILFDPEGNACKDYVGGYIPASCPITNLFVIDRQGLIRYETHYPGHPETEAMSVLKEVLQTEGNDKLEE